MSSSDEELCQWFRMRNLVNQTSKNTRKAPRRGKVSKGENDVNKSDDDSARPLSTRKRNGKTALEKSTQTKKQKDCTVVISSSEEEEEVGDTENNQVDENSSEEDSNYGSPPHKKKRRIYSKNGRAQKKSIDTEPAKMNGKHNSKVEDESPILIEDDEENEVSDGLCDNPFEVKNCFVSLKKVKQLPQHQKRGPPVQNC